MHKRHRHRLHSMRKRKRLQLQQQQQRARRSLLDKDANLNDPLLAQKDYKHLHSHNKYKQSDFVEFDSEFSGSDQQWTVSGNEHQLGLQLIHHLSLLL